MLASLPHRVDVGEHSAVVLHKGVLEIDMFPHLAGKEVEVKLVTDPLRTMCALGVEGDADF